MENPQRASAYGEELDQLPQHVYDVNQPTGEDDNNGQNPWKPVDSIAQRTFRREYLERSLERPQLTGIAFSGTVGMGIWSNTGQLISISGSAGCVLGYTVSAFIVTAVMRSLAEMVSVRPFSGGLIDFPATFVDPALGFAVGVTYWFAQCISMSALTSAAVRVASTFYTDGTSLSTGGKAGITTALLIATFLSNVCGVKLYGNLERCFKIFKIFLALFLFIFMIAVNLGLGGQRTGSKSGNYTINALPPSFRPAGFNTTENFSGEANGHSIIEIPGSAGQFLAIWSSITMAVFSCMGGDMVIVAAGEAKFPRRDIAPATRYMYLVPLICYVLLSFVVGFNINYADPSLFHPWSKYDSNISHSPFIIVLKTTYFRGLPTVINACILVSAYTAGNTGLYVSSRTLFSLAQRYGSNYIKNTLGLGKTSAGHTPTRAIICCAVLGCITFLCLTDQTYDLPISTLGSFFVGGVACVYASECIAFIRFKKGLDRLQRLDRISRDGSPYMDLYYRGHWQPFCAYVGLLGCTLLVLFSGWVPIYILSAKGKLGGNDNLLGNNALIAQIVGAYSGPILFFTLYITYKCIYTTSITPLQKLNEEVYLPPEFAWDKSKRVELNSFGDWVREIWSFTK